MIQAPTIDEPRIEMLHRLGIPFIVHGRATQVTLPYGWVDVNNRRAFKRATAFLIEQGHQNIALINGPAHLDFAIRRREGYLEALQAHHIPHDTALIYHGEMTENYGYQTTHHLLQLQEPPTALLTASLISAIGARRALQENGLRLGKDISLITYDDDLSYLKNGDDIPSFTAIRSSVRHAGKLLAGLLIDMIENPQPTYQSHLLEAELVIGNST